MDREIHKMAHDRALRDVVATLDAHVGNDDGWCVSAMHRDEPQRHPCGIRYHFEGVLNSLRRET